MSLNKNSVPLPVRALTCAVMALVFVYAPRAAAQSAVSLTVAVEIKAPRLKLAWAGLIEDIEKDLTERWVTHLADRFKHWDLQSDPLKPYGKLVLKVLEPEPNKVVISMTWKQRRATREDVVWSRVWLTPFDFSAGRRPKRENAKEKLRHQTFAFFGTPEETRLFEVLRNVPLGNNGSWTGDVPPRAITSLPWSRFQKLNRSTLKLIVKGATRVEIEGEVMETPAAYDGSSTRPTYDALVVNPYEDAAGLVGGLEPETLPTFRIGRIYLVEERQGVDEDFFD